MWLSLKNPCYGPFQTCPIPSLIQGEALSWPLTPQNSFAYFWILRKWSPKMQILLCLRDSPMLAVCSGVCSLPVKPSVPVHKKNSIIYSPLCCWMNIEWIRSEWMNAHTVNPERPPLCIYAQSSCRKEPLWFADKKGCLLCGSVTWVSSGSEEVVNPGQLDLAPWAPCCHDGGCGWFCPAAAAASLAQPAADLVLWGSAEKEQ